MKGLLSKKSIKDLINKNKLAFALAFTSGVLISTIPYIFKLIETLKIERLIQEEKLMRIKEKEKECKDINSSYTKFLNLGFPETAIVKFNACMQEK